MISDLEECRIQSQLLEKEFVFFFPECKLFFVISSHLGGRTVDPVGGAGFSIDPTHESHIREDSFARITHPQSYQVVFPGGIGKRFLLSSNWEKSLITKQMLRCLKIFRAYRSPVSRLVPADFGSRLMSLRSKKCT